MFLKVLSREKKWSASVSCDTDYVPLCHLPHIRASRYQVSIKSVFCLITVYTPVRYIIYWPLTFYTWSCRYILFGPRRPIKWIRHITVQCTVYSVQRSWEPGTIRGLKISHHAWYCLKPFFKLWKNSCDWRKRQAETIDTKRWAPLKCLVCRSVIR